MKNIPLTALILYFFVGVGMECFGQVTYTSDGDGGWIRTPASGGCTTIIDHPNQDPISGIDPDCEITFIVNHPVNFLDLNFGGNVEFIVNSGGSLTVTNNVSITGDTRLNSIISNGGDIIIQSNFLINNGGNKTKTELNIELFNGGTIEIQGLLDLGNDVNLVIDGDEREINPLRVNTFNIGQRTKVDILNNGGLLVIEDVDYRGNNSSINVYGFFRTEGSVIITGGNGNQLNVYEGAIVVIEQNLDVRGTSDITFGGNSITDIGGDILVSGNSQVTATQNSQVNVCGSFPEPCGADENNCQTYELIEGQFNDCRILPVEFTYQNAYYNVKTRTSIISWATAKEWESSHFEIERADQGLDFEKIGEVNAAGWSDVITAYNFEDSNIPLSAGSILYRIKQVDLNDEIVYSSVMSIRTPEMEATKGVWRAYPNPINGGQLRIGLLDKSQYREEKISFRLIHPTWESQLITVATEDEMNEALASTIGHISKGVFVIEIQWGNKVEYIKVLNP